MDKRAPLRQHYQTEASNKLQEERHKQSVAQISALEKTLVTVFKSLIQYLDGHTSKTEVVNQLKSIETPDINKVVNKLSQLQNTVLGSKLDLTPLLEAINGVKAQVSSISIPEINIPEQKDTVTVTNLDEVKFDTSAIEKAIKGLKLNPTIETKAPIVNVDAPDLSSLKTGLLDIVNAVKSQSFEVPATDLSTLEKESKAHTKQLEEANKHLKKIVEKPVGGGGGGGGHGTPYVDADGKATYVTLQDGALPIYGEVTTTPAEGGATELEQQEQTDILNQILSASLAVASARGLASDLRVTLIGGTTAVTGTLTGVTTVTGLTNIGGLPAQSLVTSTNNTAAVLSNINNVSL